MKLLALLCRLVFFVLPWLFVSPWQFWATAWATVPSHCTPGADKERGKTVKAICVNDFCRIVSNRVRFHCWVNHRVFYIFLRWNTLNVTYFLWKNYDGDKALQKASTPWALIKIVQHSETLPLLKQKCPIYCCLFYLLLTEIKQANLNLEMTWPIFFHVIGLLRNLVSQE